MRIATVDVGTNTALLLVAYVSGGTLQPLQEEQRFVRLGEGVDRTMRISTAAMDRLKTVLLEYRRMAEEGGASEIIVAGTSASRDAENKDELIAFIHRETGLSYEVLSGHEEAFWSFAGAVSSLKEVTGACATVDIGGGSTEITIGERGATPWDVVVRYRHSFNGGSVRLTERLFSAQPPAPAEIAEAEAMIRSMIAVAAVPPIAGLPFVGVAGTVVSLALIEWQAQFWTEVQGQVSLTAEVVHRWRERLLRLSYDEVLDINPQVMQGRADVFPAGVLILDVLMQRLGVAECLVSPRDLRHGLALRYMAQHAAS